MSPRQKQEFTLPPTPDFSQESWADAQGYAQVCGIDEAGRGPLAGPVVAAAVILPRDYLLEGLNDSKKLTPKRREELSAHLLSDTLVRCSIAEATVAEIDRFNILRATHIAMRRAAEGLFGPPNEDQLESKEAFCLIDGLAVPNFPWPSQNLVKGDARSCSIAAASILAKVAHDKAMLELDARYPQYGFIRHQGYGTSEHINAIQQYGITPEHRLSFEPVAQKTLSLEF